MARRHVKRGQTAIAVLTIVASLAAGDADAGAAVHRVVLGRSVEGRPIVAFEVGAVRSHHSMLVVGCIHGDEPAGIAIARRLEQASPRGVALWIIPVLNPDGLVAGTRGNAHGVDLNRNFPWRWTRLSGQFDSGPRSLSEPESRIIYRFIRRLRPQTSIWFHQHLAVVDTSGGDAAVERRFAALVGLPTAHLRREPGSVVDWQNHTFARTTAFVVELPTGTLTPGAVGRYARAVLAVAR